MDPVYCNDDDILRRFIRHAKSVGRDAGQPRRHGRRPRRRRRHRSGDRRDLPRQRRDRSPRKSSTRSTPAASRSLRCLPQGRARQALDQLILTSLKEDRRPSGCRRTRRRCSRFISGCGPGNPPQLEKAKELFREKFQDPNRYRLGKVGRFRINRKFDQDIPESEMTLRALDYLNAIRYILQLRGGIGSRRRHRPPWQSPAAHHRRIGRRRAAQGVPQAAPHGAGTHVDPRSAGHDAAFAHQSQEHLGGHRVFLRPGRIVAGRGPDESAGPAHARTPAVGPWTRRTQPQTGRLRGARRAHFALWPDLSHRDA